MKEISVLYGGGAYIHTKIRLNRAKYDKISHGLNRWSYRQCSAEETNVVGSYRLSYTIDAFAQKEDRFDLLPIRHQ